MIGKCARAVSLLCDYMNKTPETRSFVSGWEGRISFLLDGESAFGVIFSKDGSVAFENTQVSDPDVIFYCDSETFFGVITGKIDQDEAFSNGLVEVRGSIFDSVRFRHAAEITQLEHRTLFTVLRAVSRFT